ncbi:hypothetical protein Bbelb_025320 [Branchiostoma belcheri]|nr:hypothetical protein Bbelb_025320 [Branchiostoma belcheri]
MNIIPLTLYGSDLKYASTSYLFAKNRTDTFDAKRRKVAHSFVSRLLSSDICHLLVHSDAFRHRDHLPSIHIGRAESAGPTADAFHDSTAILMDGDIRWLIRRGHRPRVCWETQNQRRARLRSQITTTAAAAVDTLFPPQDEPELAPPQTRTTYSKQKIATQESWNNVRDDLFNTSVEMAVPISYTCTICRMEEECLIFRCRECGPAAMFCIECLRKQHEKLNSFHMPDKWEGSYFRPYQLHHTMQLPHHASCTTRLRIKSLRIFDQAGCGWAGFSRRTRETQGLSDHTGHAGQHLL